MAHDETLAVGRCPLTYLRQCSRAHGGMPLEEMDICRWAVLKGIRQRLLGSQAIFRRKHSRIELSCVALQVVSMVIAALK